MNKVILHTGYFPDIETLVRDLGCNLQVAGNIHMTPKEMSEYGYYIRPHVGDWAAMGDNHVFTNSDHVLNGLRLALKKGELNVEQVQVFFHEFETAPVEIKFSQNGRSSNWPEGFMDQIENDLSQL